MRAINFSFGIPLASGATLDGNSLLTQFIDWSAHEHDTLYVVAGNEGAGGIPVPTDNFNGMTVAFSTQNGGVYREADSRNVTTSEDAVGDRTSVDILAPGDDVELTGFMGAETHETGTSYSAPHVTGTVALLQEHAKNQIDTGALGWDEERSRRHEVMKAVLMNSADKFIDDGTVVPPGKSTPVPEGGLLGMTRTVVKQDGTSTFFNSNAYDDDVQQGGQFFPLDIEMGAGHLNANRARTQFAPGEFDSDGADVPTIGWDYGTTTGQDDINRYRFAGELMADSFISITLAWDRVVNFETDAGTIGEYDMGDTFEEYVDDGINPPDDSVINDLNIFLLPKFAASINQAIAASVANVGTLEHLFFQIPETGEYEFWVRQFDADIPGGPTSQDYAVAWWARSALPFQPPGDYNGDTIVDAQDYDAWTASFGNTVAAGTGADGNENGIIDAADYVIWRKNVGTAGSGGQLAAVPEPSAIVLALALLGAVQLVRRRRRG